MCFLSTTFPNAPAHHPPPPPLLFDQCLIGYVASCKCCTLKGFSKIFLVFNSISSRILKTLPPNGPFPSNSFFSAKKTISKVAIIRTKSATIAFFSSTPPFFLALSFLLFFSLLSVIGAYRAQKTCLLTPFHSNDCKFR